MQPHAIIFPDTNSLLHYPPLKDVNWREIAIADSVTLVFCMQVIHELDEKKSDPRLASRAERAIKEIETIVSSNGAVRDGVVLTVFNHELRATDFPDSLSPDSKDDRIVHLVKKYMEVFAASDVLVYTEDLGMVLRCKANDISVIKPDKGTRLESPQSDQDKKYKAAITELNNLKNRLPILLLTALIRDQKDENSPVELEETQCLICDPDSQVDVARRKWPLVQEIDSEDDYGSRLSSLGVNRVSRHEKQRYNQELKEFYLAYHRYFTQLNEAIRSANRLIIIDVKLDNAGAASADDIDICINFPAIFSFIAIVDSDEARAFTNPTMPSPPEKPRTQFEIQINRDFLSPTFPMFRSAHDDEANSARVVRNAADSYEFHVNLGRLKHLNEIRIGSLLCVIANWNDVKPFTAHYSISTVSHPERIEGKLTFKIRRKEKQS